MSNKTALITGGARGIGAATAKELANNGFTVIINYVNNEAAANAVVEEIKKAGKQAYAYKADVRNQSQINQMCEDIIKKHGRIDVLVSNANMSFELKPFLHQSWEEFSEKLNSEMFAAYNMTKAVVPSMIENKFGRIIFVSSILSEMPSPYFIAHGTAKGALDSFNKYLAQELGPMGITSNIVAPGLVLTDATAGTPDEQKEMIKNFTPMQRLATPKDIANTIAFLAKDESSFMTGTYIPVSGGAFMK